MRVKIQQFLFGQNHSWSVVGKAIARSIIKKGHEVDLISTDGINPKFIDADLAPFIKSKPEGVYDSQISYTALPNFQFYLSHGIKNRFAIWNYEFDILPLGFTSNIKYIDKFLPSSKFFYDICVKNYIPKDKMQILSHGVDWDKFENAVPMKLNTEKKYKWLVNFGQPHIRKNIPGTLEAFGRAFTKEDNVCLVIKCVNKKPEHPFEINFQEVFNKFHKKHPNHAECVILPDYISNIECLYKACDGLFMLPNSECFFFPALEMLASGGLVITSNYGGQLDFLTKENSFLIDGKMIRAPKEAQYWSSSPYASMFEPDINQAAEQLKYVYHNMESCKQIKLSNLSELKEKFNWDTITSQLIDLCV